MTCFLNGKIREVYEPPYWDDLRVPTSATNRGGANDPRFLPFLDDGSGSVGVFTWQFRTNQEEELFFECQIPHHWKEGTIIKPHIHWSPMDAGAGGVVWGLEYTIATPLAVFPNTTLITVTDPTDTTAFKHQIAILPDIPMVNNKISTMLSCRIYRAGNDPADTYGTEAALLEIDFHYQLNTPGSLQEYIK